MNYLFSLCPISTSLKFLKQTVLDKVKFEAFSIESISSFSQMLTEFKGLHKINSTLGFFCVQYTNRVRGNKMFLYKLCPINIALIRMI